MADTQNITKIPAPRVPLVDERTGLISREWFRFFNNIYVITGGTTQGITQIENGGTGASTAARARQNLGAGTVSRVIGTGFASGLSLVGDITTSGTISLQGTVIVNLNDATGSIDIDTQTSGNLPIDTRTTGNLDVATRATGVLPVANGGTGLAVRPTVVTKVADFTLADTEGWVINNKSGSTCTVTLPAASAWSGRAVTFKNLQLQTLVSASSNVVPLIGGAAGTAILPGFGLTTTEKVTALQNELLKMPQADIVTTHTFLPGAYERSIAIPAWTVLTGAEHKTPYRVRLEKGTIAVNTDDGVKILTAPCEFEARAGMQRAGRVYDEDVIWVDIYDNPDNCTDLAILEDRLYVVPECGLGDSRTDAQKARIDYGLFLHQLVGKRTPGGRFINHSANSNIQPEMVGDDIFVLASRKINAGDELLVDYRASMRVNFGFTMQGELL
jgi:hypothetical protein